MSKINRLKAMYLLIVLTVFCIQNLYSQISYANVSNKNFSMGSYGRIGVDWSFENNGSIGQRLNLNNMGSIGGRLEEQDYLELAPSIHFKPFNDSDPTQINVNFRFSLYSNSLSLFGNSTSSSLGGLTLSIPEMYVEAKNISGSGVNVWVGSRLYRGPDVHITDHFYFNDHSGQGFGVEYKNTRFASLFISSTDTSATVPPYFYLNIASGTPSAALRQRNVFVLEQDILLSEKQKITLLGEAHYMGNYLDEDIELPDTTDIILDYESDYGLVAGVRLTINIDKIGEGSNNQIAVRYGSRIANGGDGGMSRTWLTYGAPDLNKKNYEGAMSFSIVDDLLLNFSDKSSLNLYLIYNYSKGAASSDSTAKTYFGREVFNQKKDLTVGFRHIRYVTDKFHLISEAHYSQRRDGVSPLNSMMKFSLAPTLVPTGERSFWARPHLRFVTSVARYNDAAMDSLYSPYLATVGAKRWGYYLGVKAEWWIN